MLGGNLLAFFLLPPSACGILTFMFLPLCCSWRSLFMHCPLPSIPQEYLHEVSKFVHGLGDVLMVVSESIELPTPDDAVLKQVDPTPAGFQSAARKEAVVNHFEGSTPCNLYIGVGGANLCVKASVFVFECWYEHCLAH